MFELYLNGHVQKPTLAALFITTKIGNFSMKNKIVPNKIYLILF